MGQDVQTYGITIEHVWEHGKILSFPGPGNVEHESSLIIIRYNNQNIFKRNQKWASGISKRAFSGQAEGWEMPKINIENQNTSKRHHFWARAREMPQMSLGIGHWKCPNEFRKPQNEYFKPRRPREMSEHSFGCMPQKRHFWAMPGEGRIEE